MCVFSMSSTFNIPYRTVHQFYISVKNNIFPIYFPIILYNYLNEYRVNKRLGKLIHQLSSMDST